MTQEQEIDVAAAHKYFGPACFNDTWSLIEALGDAPTAEEQENLVLSAAASMWHWRQRDDVSATNESVGAWLLARVYALIDRPAEALNWANRSLQKAQQAGGEKFYVGYAFEALARATAKEDTQKFREYLMEAKRALDAIDDEDSRQLLAADLAELSAD